MGTVTRISMHDQILKALNEGSLPPVFSVRSVRDLFPDANMGTIYGAVAQLATSGVTEPTGQLVGARGAKEYRYLNAPAHVVADIPTPRGEETPLFTMEGQPDTEELFTFETDNPWNLRRTVERNNTLLEQHLGAWTNPLIVDDDGKVYEVKVRRVS